MATTTSSQVAQTNATGTMRPHVVFFEALMAAASWVQTGDTGQTASGSFPAASGTLTAAGYQIWHMNDSLEATKPVFVKFEFGSGAVSISLGLWITIGTGSDGAGNITGVLVPRTSLPGQGTTASSLPSYGSGNTSRLTAFHTYSTLTPNTNIMWNIERSKDGSGADTNVGVIFQSEWSSATLGFYIYAPFTGNIRTGQTTPSIVNSSTIMPTSLVDGANIGLLPVLPFGMTGPVEPGLGLMMYYGPDIAAGATPTITVRGGSHTYRTFGTPFGWSNASNLWTSSSWAMLYE